VGEPEREGLAVGVPVPVGDGVALTVEVAEGDAPDERDVDGVVEAMALVEGVRDTEGDPVTLAVGVGDGVTEGVPVGVPDGEGVLDADTAPFAVAVRVFVGVMEEVGSGKGAAALQMVGGAVDEAVGECKAHRATCAAACQPCVGFARVAAICTTPRPRRRQRCSAPAALRKKM
jgi:hypothetical protein